MIVFVREKRGGKKRRRKTKTKDKGITRPSHPAAGQDPHQNDDHVPTPFNQALLHQASNDNPRPLHAGLKEIRIGY